MDSPRRSRSPGTATLALSQQQSLQERLRLREERKQQEELLKAFETPEEKRARRLAKKEAKERKKREKMGWGEEYMGYTNTDNPFGDNNLLGTFIWNKALEKKGISHLEEKELKERNKRIQEDNRLELQKVKQLRLEREREKAMREQELELLQREKEAEHFKTWEEQEDSFHLRQAKLRSKIRIRDGRAKPIDLLAKYISAEDDDLAVEMHEPYTFLNGLTVADMEDLLEDIQVYMELEQGKNVDFWRDMTTITEDEIAKLRKLEASGKGPGERREGVNASVSSDVQSVFKGKTYNQLQVIFQGIEGKIRAGGPNLDMGYWESLLQQLRAHMARARLRERHQDVLRQKLFKLKQEQGVESEPLFPILKSEPSAAHSPEPEERPPSPGTSVDPVEPVEPEEATAPGEAEGEAEGEAVLMEEDLIQQSLADYDAGRYSPRLLTAHELPLDAHVLEPHEDLQRLQLSRQQLQATGDASESAEDIFFRRAREGMGQDEAQFSVEMPLGGRAYLWADKYRPRKPRFFNRVHTGFEWKDRKSVV